MAETTGRARLTRAHAHFVRSTFPVGRRTVYSRPAAVVGTIAWLVATVSVIVGGLGASLSVLDASAAVVVQVGVIAWAGCVVLVVAPAMGSVAHLPGSPVDAALLPPRWARVLAFVIPVGLCLVARLVTLDWTPFPRLDAGTWVRFGLSVAAVALLGLVVGQLLELHLVFTRLVWRQIKGWRRGPFEDWTADDHEALQTPTAFNDRFPAPITSEMARAEARNFGLLARATADRIAMVAQLMALLGGGLLSAAIPDLLNEQTRGRGSWSAMIGILVAAVAFRISVTTVETWTARAKSYEAYVEALGDRPPGPPGEPQTSTGKVMVATAGLIGLAWAVKEVAVARKRVVDSVRRAARRTAPPG